MSIKNAVETAHSGMKKKGVRTIEVEKGHKSGYITTTRHHDYEKPSEVQPHNSIQSVMKHIKGAYGDGDGDE